MRLLTAVVALLCLMFVVEAQARPKMYYQTQPDGSVTFFQKGPKIRTRTYFQAVAPNSVNPVNPVNPAPTAKPAMAAPAVPTCPHCGRPLPTK